MRRKDNEKNGLDLSYHRNLQLLNAILFLGGGSSITYFAALIINKDERYQYTIIFVILLIIFILLYSTIDKRLKNISNEIRKL